MDLRDVDFLRVYLEHHPELKTSLRAEPLAVWFRRGWRRIRGLRFLKSGIECTIGGGRRLRLVPKEGRVAVRDRWRVPCLNLLQRHFPHWKILKILAGTDRNRHQTAALLRLLLWNGEHYLAAVTVYPGESPQLSERVLSSIVLWWHDLHGKVHAKQILIFIPEGWSESLLNIFPRLKIPLICYKYQLKEEAPGKDLRQSELRQIYPSSAKSSEVGSPYVLFPYRQDVPLPLKKIQQQHPSLLLSFRQGRWELAFRGLPIAWYEDVTDRCLFNRTDPCVLTESTWQVFEEYLRQITQVRCFPPRWPEHPYYRLAQERWLECLIVRDHSVLNADFVDYIYSQVPTCLDGERKVLDLLTATREGRVAILELKVERNLDLVFQALDYWERVWHHLKQGDLQQAGYFPGRTLLTEPPLLYLISPLFEFHRVMPVFGKYLEKEIVLTCIGINLDWKRELTILRRFEF